MSRMPCFRPNICYVLRVIGEEKRYTFLESMLDYNIYFDKKKTLLHKYKKFKLKDGIKNCFVEKMCIVPCGSCLGCSLENSKDWSNRLKMEYLTHLEKNDLIPYFITLTYNDDFLPKNHQLNFNHINDLVRKLKDYIRYNFESNIRYLVCGEYGPKNARPHYHGIFWLPVGFDFDSFLSSHWLKGFYQIKVCFAEHLNYISHYSVKKSSLARATRKELVLSGIEFERSLKSRGIGYQFLIDHFDQIIDDKFLVIPSSYSFISSIPEFNENFSHQRFSPGRSLMKIAEKIGRKDEISKKYHLNFKFYRSLMIRSQILMESNFVNYMKHCEFNLKMTFKSVKRQDL